ncbi:hypothetical protein EDD22DRAFT_980306 [Suillus occidentalis]|nr:hypothetical protein EDD22DRAFT_980306 [Suillus occidentalis]
MWMFLWNYTRAYILDWDDLPLNIYGTWNSSILKDEDFKEELLLYLQGIGKYVRAMDIVDYIRRPDILARLKLKKTISLATAQHWMKHVGYHWLKTPTGQFVGGHERSDVVAYRQLVFLPVWAELFSQTRIYGTDGNECQVQPTTTHRVIIWNHDKSTYYTNDRQKIQWVHNLETAIPYTKGEGASLMVANMASNAMDILEHHFLDEDHVIVFNNATTYLKRADDALSAHKIPQFPPRHGKEWDGSNWTNNGQPTNWGVEVNVVDENGKFIHKPSGEIKKKKVKMCDATFADSSPQSLYYPEGHQLAGHADVSKCKKGVECCCCQRMLFNEPNFMNVKSLLKIACKARGFQAIFFPKFHCELNFIEQCWGYSKWLYREFPASSKEVDLEHNVLTALASVLLDAICW